MYRRIVLAFALFFSLQSVSLRLTDFPGCPPMVLLVAAAFEEDWRAATRLLTGRTDGTTLNGIGIEYGTHAEAAAIAALSSATPLEIAEMVVVTHPSVFQVAIAAALRDPRFRGFPRLGLTNIRFPATSKRFVRQMTILQNSQIGEFAANFNASVVHLMGGSANNCLIETGHCVIRELLDIRGRDSVELRFHAQLIYGGLAGVIRERDASMAEQLNSVPRNWRRRRAREWAERFAAGDTFQTARLVYESGETLDGGFRFVFRRPSDRKTVTIVIEGLEPD